MQRLDVFFAARNWNRSQRLKTEDWSCYSCCCCCCWCWSCVDVFIKTTKHLCAALACPCRCRVKDEDEKTKSIAGWDRLRAFRHGATRRDAKRRLLDSSASSSACGSASPVARRPSGCGSNVTRCVKIIDFPWLDCCWLSKFNHNMQQPKRKREREWEKRKRERGRGRARSDKLLLQLRLRLRVRLLLLLRLLSMAVENGNMLPS